MAFQIQDDLLDILPSEENKKSSFSDIKEGQHTLLTNHIFHTGTPSQKRALRQAWRKSAVDKEALQAVFYDAGAIDEAEKKIKKYLQHAHKLLETTTLSATIKGSLSDLMTYIAKRSY